MNDDEEEAARLEIVQARLDLAHEGQAFRHALGIEDEVLLRGITALATVMQEAFYRGTGAEVEVVTETTWSFSLSLSRNPPHVDGEGAVLVLFDISERSWANLGPVQGV